MPRWQPPRGNLQERCRRGGAPRTKIVPLPGAGAPGADILSPTSWVSNRLNHCDFETEGKNAKSAPANTWLLLPVIICSTYSTKYVPELVKLWRPFKVILVKFLLLLESVRRIETARRSNLDSNGHWWEIWHHISNALQKPLCYVLLVI